MPTVEDFMSQVYKFLEQFSLESSHKNPLVVQPKRKKKVSEMSEDDQIALAMRQSLGKLDESEGESEVEIIEKVSKNKGKSITQPVAISDSSESPVSVPLMQEGDEEEKEVKEGENGELTDEDLFALIPKSTNPEPEASEAGTTRIQFRLADGTRIVRRFHVTDTVRTIFGVVKATVEKASNEYFSLSSERKRLITMLDMTIEEAGLKNSSVLVEVLD